MGRKDNPILRVIRHQLSSFGGSVSTSGNALGVSTLHGVELSECWNGIWSATQLAENETQSTWIHASVGGYPSIERKTSVAESHLFSNSVLRAGSSWHGNAQVKNGRRKNRRRIRRINVRPGIEKMFNLFISVNGSVNDERNFTAQRLGNLWFLSVSRLVFPGFDSGFGLDHLSGASLDFELRDFDDMRRSGFNRVVIDCWADDWIGDDAATNGVANESTRRSTRPVAMECMQTSLGGGWLVDKT